ncbi:MAG: ABC transporter permease [Thermoanaerobaculia bacterium]
MSALLAEFRVALRSLARVPGYAIAVVAILALGVGANVAIFSVVHRELIAPLPYPDSDRLVRIWETYSHDAGFGTASAPNFRDWSARADSFAALAAYTAASRNLQGAGDPERLPALESTASLFSVLGARPIVGRLFTADDERPESSRVAVLAERFWRRRFGADPGVVGRPLVLDGVAHVVVGVLPDSFRYPTYGAKVDLYLPHLPGELAEMRGEHYLGVLGKLAPGVPIERGRKQLEEIAARLEMEYPDAQTGRGVRVLPLTEAIRGSIRPTLLLLFGAVGAVLAIACANLAGLALARAAARQREMSIRAALGASRFQVVRQLAVENLLLTAAGLVLAVAVARGLLAWLAPRVAQLLPDLGALRIDFAAFAFLLAIGGATGLLFGLAPTLALSRDQLARELVESGLRATGGRGRQRARRTLVTAQVALSTTLLLGAGLLLRTFFHLQGVSPGFDRVGVLTLHLSPDERMVANGTVGATLLAPMLDRLSALPGVESAGVVSLLPIQNWGRNTSYTIEGLQAPPAGEEWWVETRAASADAFRALGVPLKAGRFLAASDAAASQDDRSPAPCLVNQAFVRRHFPAGDVLGRRVRFGGEDYVTIVGVVGDVRQGGLEQESLPELTFLATDPRVANMFANDIVLVVRSALPTSSLAAAVRAAVREIAPQQPVHTLLTLDEVLSASLADRRLTLWMVGAFATLAIFLSATGLYALVAFLVTQRAREVGVRMAIGATAPRIARWILSEAVVLAAIGLAAGLAGGAALSRLVASQLAGVSPLDPATWIAVALFIAAVAVGAGLGPALAAARTEPIAVLRSE